MTIMILMHPVVLRRNNELHNSGSPSPTRRRIQQLVLLSYICMYGRTLTFLLMTGGSDSQPMYDSRREPIITPV
ncbi:hypothetical protein DAEQUDRAFT_246545 [Daedalea quercina L-15889]|uniref:Uncharacterized protein n=1 Tax=Daedalea quercina L-15889 TaxID=1314783 RepID=A0A165QLT1_9APHY|nr:hypothetical protein DAEQUDRAFT_246545 [Daedalea quercina L-15889]